MNPGLLKDALGNFKRRFIRRVLADHQGNITKTAGELGIARKNLYRKLDDYGICRKG